MKNIIFSILFIFIIINPAVASEITGKISTNMKTVIGNNDMKNDSGGPKNGDAGSSGGNRNESGETPGAIIKNQGSAAVPVSVEKEKGEPETKNQAKNIFSEVKVLGVSAVNFDDGTLAREPDMKIYLIERGQRRYIPGIKELARYAGREILDVEEGALDQYEIMKKKYSDGQLVRAIGQEKVYAIKNGAKRHILNLEELRKNYFGLEIFNISSEELSDY